MKQILNQNELMTEYTNLVLGQITKGHILKVNRGCNSMYESETHLTPTNPKYSSLLVALERTNDKKNGLGLLKVWDTDVLTLVVKNVKHTFDDGDLLFSKTIVRFENNKCDERGNQTYFYVTDRDMALEIVKKRDLRSTQKWNKREVEITPTTKFANKLRKHKGFTNVKASQLKVTRNNNRYLIVNTALKTRPELIVRF